MTDVSILEVMLHDTPIGTLTHVSSDQTLFAFTQSYIDDLHRSTLSLHFKGRMGDLLTKTRPYNTKLMPFFSNLLPEGHLRKYLGERAGVNPKREFFLISVLGHDLPGAISVRPLDGSFILPGTYTENDDEKTTNDPQEHVLRFSLAGVQLKFSAIAEASGGLTVPANGVGGSWIVKLPSREFSGVPENEFSMMTLAQKIGMDVPEIDLVDLDSIGNLPEGSARFGDKAFVIKRFDRQADGPPLHIEDFAQVYGVYPEDKYEKASLRNIATVIGAETSDLDIAEFTRRMVFNTLIGNGDMHLKNWSLIYPDQRHAALAPAYDFVSTIPYIPNDRAALNYSRTKDFTGLTEDEITHLAAKAALPLRLMLNTARETVDLFHQNWAAEKNHLPMHTEVVEAIDRHLTDLPIARFS